MNVFDAATEAPLHEHLRAHARRTPEQTAILWYGRAISYRELDRLSDAGAAVLHRHGVRKGEPVALFMQNCPQYVIAHLAIQKLGAIVSPCSPLFKAAELAYQLADLGAQVVIAAANLYPIFCAVRDETQVRTAMVVHYADMLPQIPSYAPPAEMLQARPQCAGAVDLLAGILEETLPPPRPALDMDDVALLVYTSGTTGRPKGAMLSYRNCMFKTASLARLAGLAAADVHLAIPPLYHISGMLYGINLPLFTGACMVLHYRFEPVATLQSIAAHRVTYWKGIAPMLVAVMDAPDADGYDVSSLRVTSASSFGIRMTPELSQRWNSFTGGCIATEAGYGLSETHTGDVVTLPHEVRWGTNGRLVPGVQCRILDPKTGHEAALGDEGEIVLRSPGNFHGYWKQPQKTAETLRDGWVHTGDVGKIDADGYLTLLGRIKELIKVSGYSVFPEDVEALLMRHPGVLQVAVVGVPDPAKGEVVKAVVVPRPQARASISAQELTAWSRENMSAYKVPRVIEFRDELPTTASGKVLRRLV